MNSLSNLRLPHTAWFSCRFALALPLLVILAPGNVFAQQGWAQNPQYGYGQYPQNAPYGGQYATNQPAPYAQQPYPAIDQEQGPGYDQGYAQPPAQPLDANQLEQLVAPIALYPDALVAQILAAATYPAQVVAADHWLQAQGYAPQDQIAYAADAQPWDPSVKALTAFPQVLAQMDRDLQWTTDLGNAYYNQPQDVLGTVQVLRQRAQAVGTLQNTPQEAVSYNQGYIQLAPVNPQVVYVPAYNPWDVYGQPVQPYPGFSLLGSLESFAGSSPVRFGLGIAMSAFSHTPFGWAGWALNWLTNSVLFHQSNYISQSTSVAHWGSSRGGYYERGFAGVNRTPNGYARSANGYAPPAFTRPPVRAPESYAYNRPAAGNYARPAMPNYAYNRPQPQPVMPARPQTYARPGGYGDGFYSNSQQAYAARPAAPYAGQQVWRAPASTYQRNDFAQRSYAADRPYPVQRSNQAASKRGYEEAFGKQERSGGFRMFGGGQGEKSAHVSYKAPKMPKAPKAPKAPKMSGGGHHGGGGLFGHHGR